LNIRKSFLFTAALFAALAITAYAQNADDFTTDGKGTITGYTGNFTFRDCTGLTNISIGNGVTSIGSYILSGCTSLISVTFQGSFPRWLASNAFGDKGSADYIGDLREKYLANGIGTYTTTAPVGNKSVWTKQ